MTNSLTPMLAFACFLWLALTAVIAGRDGVRPTWKLGRTALVVLLSMVAVYGSFGLFIVGTVRLMAVLSPSPEVRETGFWTITGIVTVAGMLWSTLNPNVRPAASQAPKPASGDGNPA